MSTELVVGFEVDGLHYWPDAPQKYKEFGQPHRHLFKVVGWYPTGDSQDPTRRDVELWELRQDTIACLDSWYPPLGGVCNFGPMSCEGIADFLKNKMGFSRVFVGEEDCLGAMVS